ncbi:MAG TPA: WD40 repeat domain-containing protein, partial [Gemmataceae bacterium]|nr:WD40 repeat domain-containing protein [Gemmataceae bacterium]
VRTKVMVLAKEALKDMLLTKLKTTVSLVLAAALLSGAGLFVSQAIAGRLAGGADPSAPPKAGAAPPGQGRQPAPSWHERATLTGHDGQVNAVAFSPDGKTLASGGQDCAVVLWDLVTGKARTTLRGHQEPVACVAFSPDGKLVASGSAGVLPGAAREKRGQVKLWDAASGKERATLTLGKAGGPVSALAFSADGKFLAAAGETAPLPSGTRTVNGIVQPLAPGAVGVWETATGKVRATLRDEDVPWFQALAFSPDGKRLAAVTGLLSPGQGNSVKLWDWPLQKELLVLHPPQQTGRPADNGEPAIFAAVLFCPDGKTLATVDSSAGVQFWDGETGEAKKRIRLEQREGWGLAAVTRSPDGSTWATASGHHEVKDKFHVSSGQVALWDAATGELRQRLPEGNYVASLAFSPNGKLLAAGSRGSARVPAEPRAEDLAAGKLPEAVGDKRGTVKIWEWRP